MRLPISVLVTGVGGRSVGHQVLQAVARTENGYRTIATDAVPFSYGLYEADQRYLVPVASDPDYLDAIGRIVDRENVKAILPGTQPETALLAAHAARFPGCQVIANPSAVVQLCSNKRTLQNWLQENGFAVPMAAGRDNWQALVRDCGFPIVAKPAEDTGGSRGVAILADENELRMYLRTVADSDILFQEYIGDVGTEYTVGVMTSREGRIVDSIVMHRRLVGLTLGTKREINGKVYGLSTGYSQGCIVKHEQIQSVCEMLAQRLGSRGALNIQLRLCGEKVVVFEVHPRFSGTTWIRAQAGYNEPDTLIQNFVFGREFGRIPYQSDVAAIRALCSVLVPRSQMLAVERA